MNIIEQIPKDLLNFLLVTLFSLLIGLEQRRKAIKEEEKIIFGTDRTYAFTGILGFVLYTLSPQNLILYILGAVSIIIFLAIFYLKKIEKAGKYGITSSLTLLITYTLPLIVCTKPLWFSLLVVTTLLTLIEMKEQFIEFTKKFSDEEFSILAKFLVISGVVLPLLPNESIASFLPFSPFKIWLVIVVVSTISYLSYILHKFVFPKSGIILTGLLGGIYSSTATTFILSRNSKSNSANAYEYSMAIIIATSMMFIRILILAYIFNPSIAHKLLMPFAMMFLTAIVFWGIYYKIHHSQKHNVDTNTDFKRNPLEFRTAFIFAVLFVGFGILTNFVFEKFGTLGLNWLSVIIGVSDIDPFLLGLFTGKYQISVDAIKTATLIAISSNNMLKLVYSLILGDKSIAKPLIYAFVSIILIGILTILLF